LKDPPPPVPEIYELSQNFPNPLNPATTIRYSVPEDTFVTLQVFNALGALVTTLVNEPKTRGTYDVEFNINRVSKTVVSSGVYFYRLRTNIFDETKKMIILK
jgi:hypothetical protein